MRFISRRSPSRTPKNTPRASQKIANASGAAMNMTVSMRFTVGPLTSVRFSFQRLFEPLPMLHGRRITGANAVEGPSLMRADPGLTV
jgi:hypothetical protein